MKWTAISPLLLAAHGLADQSLVAREDPTSSAKQCRCYPGDACWPSTSQWSALNQTVGGRLVRVIPPGAACYPTFNGIPTADAAQCAEVASQWGNATWMYAFLLAHHLNRPIANARRRAGPTSLPSQ